MYYGISVTKEHRVKSIESFNILIDKTEFRTWRQMLLQISVEKGMKTIMNTYERSVNLADFTLLEFQNKYQMGESSCSKLPKSWVNWCVFKK